jgi:hypothetical protein
LEEMARAENIIDLDAISKEIRTVVDAAYTRHTRRLSPAKAEEPASAK